MKLFRTNNIDTVKTYQSEFGFKLPTTLLACRKETFLCKINQCDNDTLYAMFVPFCYLDW